jgi:hypothetical protein
VALFASLVTALSLNYATYPLLLELAAETCYPIEESISSGFLTGASNLVGIVYMTFAWFPSLGESFGHYSHLQFYL